MKRRTCEALLLMLPALAAMLSAQTTTVGSGTVVGSVRDASGAVVPKVAITVKEVETGAQRDVATDPSGNFTITNLPIGFYTLRAEKPGFKTGIQERFALQVDQRVRVDLILQVGEVTERVSVTSTPPPLATDSATIGSVVPHKTMVELPLNGRNFLALLATVPGANPGRENVRQATTSGGFTASVNGQREASNDLTIDGIGATDPINNYNIIRPNLDSIAEFKVQTGLSDAEFGRTGGGLINVVTRSGTNEFHGTLFEYLRNSSLDARNFFSLTPKTPPLRQNQFGGVAGGRIIRNRTFFFVDYQGTRIRSGLTRVTRVPEATLRAGDFSGLPPVRDPGNNNLPFPNNQIRAERIDPVALKILGFVPLPNFPADPARNWNTSQSSSQTTNQYGFRVDHRFREQDSLFVRVSLAQDQQHFPGDFATPAIGDANPFNSGQDLFQPYRLVSLSETHLFSPGMVNELRLGYSRDLINRFQLNAGTDYSKQLGIQGSTSNPQAAGFPTVSVTGFAGLGNGSFLPNLQYFENRQIVDNLSINRRAHSLKMGADLRFLRMDGFYPANLRGSFSFDGTFTGTPMADFLLGYARTVSVTRQDDFVRLRYHILGLYVQDTWTVLPSLTLTLGLRYEQTGSPYEIYNRISTFDLATGALIKAGTAGWPRGLRDKDLNDFAPRFGLAWRPLGNNKTVIRGGYGMFYNMDSINPQINQGQNPPFSFTNSQIANPPNATLTLATGLTGVSAPLTPGITFQDRNFRDGYVQQFSAGVQRELVSDLVLDVSYVGTKGTKLGRYVGANQPTPGPGLIQDRRPYPGFSGISEYKSISNSIYHSVQARVEKRTNLGLSFLAAYTLGKALNDADDVFGGPYDSRNLRLERGLASFDVRQRFVFSGSYDLPFGPGRPLLSGVRGAARHLVAGWQVLSLTSIQTGNPFTVTEAGDPSNIGTTDRPNRIASGRLGNPTINRWFDFTAFQAQAPFTIGNAGRNVLTGPGMHNVDFSAFKNFSLTERMRWQFRAEFFNFLNTPQFSMPASNISVPNTVGKITATRVTARQIQFGMRLEF